MDDLIEIVLDLLVDGSTELLPNKKVPKWIRILISLILISIIIGLIVLGILLFKESILGGIIVIGVAVFLLVAIIIKIRRYMKD